MSKGKRIVGLAGSFNSASSTFNLVERIAAHGRLRYGLETAVYRLADLGPSLGSARTPQDLEGQAKEIIRQIAAADALVIGTPTYNGSYPGMFKHLMDLIDPDALAGKPVILAATGGSERHTLMIDYQLRPLLSYFRTVTLPTTIFLAPTGGQDLTGRIQRAVNELDPRFAGDGLPIAEFLMSA